jgi:hypothetical protein
MPVRGASILRDCIRVIWPVLALALVVGFAMGLNAGAKTSLRSTQDTRRAIVGASEGEKLLPRTISFHLRLRHGSDRMDAGLVSLLAMRDTPSRHEKAAPGDG